MSLIYPGHHLSAGAGQASWFDDLRVTMKANRAQTGGAYTMWEFIIPSGYAPPRHVHRDQDEAFLLLDGAMYVTCGDSEWEAGAGSFLFLPRGIPHGFVVTSAQPARCWVIASPSGPAGSKTSCPNSAGPPSTTACPNRPHRTCRPWQQQPPGPTLSLSDHP